VRLATTALEESWGKDGKKVLFLGEWCKPYLNDAWKKLDYETMPFHWKDRAKLKEDHDYLKTIYEKTLDALSVQLNHYHHVEYPKRFWRILIGPWLLTYVSVIWDRWESIRIAMENYDIDSVVAIDDLSACLVPNDYEHAITLFDAHLWNHGLYQDIIENQYAEVKVERTFSLSQHKDSIDFPRVKKSLKHRFGSYIDRTLALLPLTNRVMLVNSYFSVWSTITLSIRLGQIPRLYSEFNKSMLYPKSNYKMRRKMSVEMSCGSSFEEFISAQLFYDIPVAYFEGYEMLDGYASTIVSQPRIVFTANSHHSNDIFKLWAGKNIQNNKAKLVISSHGGSLRSEMNMFDHEEDVSDIKTVWSKPYHFKQKTMPPNKIIGAKIFEKNENYLSVIGLELPLYSYRCQSGPSSSLILDDYAQKRLFIKSLQGDIVKLVRIKPYPDRGWSTKQRYIDDFGAEKISDSNDIYEVFGSSKVILCTYPQTTFSEAMHSGRPTILLYMEEYWETQSVFDELLDELKSASIVFSCPEEAANHINVVWDNPSEWWNSPKTVEAREMFFDTCGRVEDDSLDVWADFFKQMLND